MSLEWKGKQSFFKKLQQKPADILRILPGSMYRKAETIITAAKVLTPVDKGHLKNSGHVQPPVVTADSVEVKLGFGGPAASYALFVHENLEAHHPVGQAKFLEVPFKQAKPTMAKDLAEDINKGS